MHEMLRVSHLVIAAICLTGLTVRVRSERTLRRLPMHKWRYRTDRFLPRTTQHL